MDIEIAFSVCFNPKPDFHRPGQIAPVDVITRSKKLGAAGQWQQITAAVESFDVPQWSSGEVEWSAIDRWQLTAFGSGPYDGKYIIVDQVVSVGSKSPRPAKDTGVIERGGAIHVRQR